jgi:two-component system, cell cycle sensor histidine kinase and response regulator CckA
MRIKPGRYSCIAFEDTGSGIDAETLDKIFEPFFTTKAHGKGTGLGLPTALGIIRSHKGLIRVDSKPGEGTEFQVYLPASNVEAPGAVSQEAASKFEGTRELVLIVDDEETIRKTIRFALSKSDCRTLEANNGQEALGVLKAHSGEISLVITDRMMPFMNGETLARNIRKDFPNVKIIGMSGAMEDPKNDQNVKEAEGEALFDAYLFKPFSRELLLQTIHKTLSQSAEPS